MNRRRKKRRIKRSIRVTPAQPTPQKKEDSSVWDSVVNFFRPTQEAVSNPQRQTEDSSIWDSIPRFLKPTQESIPKRYQVTPVRKGEQTKKEESWIDDAINIIKTPFGYGESRSPMIEKGDKLGSNIVLTYPDFKASLKDNGIIPTNTNLKIGVGHSALISISPNGQAKYMEYGRYAKGTAGKTKQSGNYRQIILPKVYENESATEYLERVKSLLPYTNSGKTEYKVIPNVDTTTQEKAFKSLSNDINRSNYNLLFNNCATFVENLVKPFMGADEKTRDIAYNTIRTVLNPFNPFINIINTPSNVQSRYGYFKYSM